MHFSLKHMEHNVDLMIFSYMHLKMPGCNDTIDFMEFHHL